MKFICTQKNLAQGVSIVASASSTDSTLPILSNILIRAQKGTVTLSATNLEIGVSCTVGGRVEQEGETTVPAKLFLQYIQSIQDEKVQLTIEKNILTIHSEHTDSKITGIDANEFPLIPQVKEKEGIKISLPGATLVEAIRKTAFAAATDVSRPEIAGVCLRLEKNSLILAATDGYRLAEYRTRIPLPIKTERQIIVPTKTMNELSRIVSLLNVDVECVIGENQLCATIADVLVSSRLIDGKYPDYSQIIPTQYGVEARVGKAELLNAIKSTSVFSKTGVNDLVLNFEPEKQALWCAASSVDTGSARSEVPAECKGKKTEVIFNHRYVVDGLSALNETQIFFGISGQGGPGVIKSAESEEYVYIVMPIKK